MSARALLAGAVAAAALGTAGWAPAQPAPGAPGTASASAVSSSPPAVSAGPSGSAATSAPKPRPPGERVVTVEPETLDIRDEPHTTFQFGLGLLALPGAEVCPISPDQCEPGETSIGLSVQNLYHFDDFAIGAGITWAFGLRNDAAAGDPQGTLGRQHSRSYFVVDGQFRYYFTHFGAWDFWAGASAGAVIVRDAWSETADRDPYSDVSMVGPRGETMATEGFAAGVGIGAQWNFMENAVFGSHFHYANWFLPGTRKLTDFGDPASLAGRVDVLDFGLMIAYRLSI